MYAKTYSKINVGLKTAITLYKRIQSLLAKSQSLMMYFPARGSADDFPDAICAFRPCGLGSDIIRPTHDSTVRILDRTARPAGVLCNPTGPGNGAAAAGRTASRLQHRTAHRLARTGHSDDNRGSHHSAGTSAQDREGGEVSWVKHLYLVLHMCNSDSHIVILVVVWITTGELFYARAN